MKREKKNTLFFVVLLIGLMFIKNLFPDVLLKYDIECYDIAHIHFFSLENEKGGAHKEDCHGDKSAPAVFSITIHELEPELPFFYETHFPIEFTIRNNMKEPYLEPRKKPPRFS